MSASEPSFSPPSAPSSSDTCSKPPSNNRVRAASTGALYSFTPPPCHTPRTKTTDGDSIDEFEEDFPPLGSHINLPKRRHIKSFSPLPAAMLTPTPAPRVSTPPPEPIQVFSPTPKKKPRASSLLSDLEETPQHRRISGEEETIIEAAGEKTPRTHLDVDKISQLAPRRAKSPFYPQHPDIIDAASLLAAVQKEPDYIFQAVCNLVNQRDTAQRELASVREDYAGAQQDHKAARETWDRLFKIEKAKQVLQWKFIDRLQRGVVDIPAIAVGQGVHSDIRVLVDNAQIARKAQMNTALNEALEIVYDEGGSHYQSFLSNIEARSNDDSSIDSADWRLGINFNPGAQTFIPMAHISPSKLLVGPHNGKKLKPNEMSDEILFYIIGTLGRFYGICPVSLTGQKPCKVKGCSLIKVCEEYNHESGRGCAKDPCNREHVYRTCPGDVENDHCMIIKQINHKKGGFAISDNKRQRHIAMRAHRITCDPEEWKHRVVLARLKDLHLAGRYLEA